MTNNLENISFEAVINPKGIPYSQFRKSLTPRYFRAWQHITVAFVLIAIPFLAYPFLPTGWRWLLAPLTMIYFGYLIAFVHLFIHEAAHFNLHPDKKTNDLLGSVILCAFFGITLKDYRKIHWQHHLHLATPDDAEISYFSPLNMKFFFRILTGVQVLSVLSTRKKTISEKNMRRTLSVKLIVTGIIHGSLILAAWFCGSYPLVISWVLAVTILFPFFATLRQVLEHRAEEAAGDADYYLQLPRERSSRLFGNNFFSRTFGGAGFNRHMIHHWDPQISYTRMEDVVRFLEQSPVTTSFIQQSKTSYLKVFFRLTGFK